LRTRAYSSRRKTPQAFRYPSVHPQNPRIAVSKSRITRALPLLPSLRRSLRRLRQPRNQLGYTTHRKPASRPPPPPSLQRSLSASGGLVRLWRACPPLEGLSASGGLVRLRRGA
jgi:hypothetical protein